MAKKTRELLNETPSKARIAGINLISKYFIEFFRKQNGAGKSVLLRNTLSLYSVQGLQYLIPIITLPWLVRALGKDNFGIFSLSIAFASYIQVVCDYGFQLSITREFASIRNDRLKVSVLVAEVVGAKMLLVIPGTIGAGILIYLIPSLRNLWIPLSLAGIAGLAGSFFPSWLYQGMERMSEMAAVSAISRVLHVVMLIVFVRHHDDLNVALGIQILGTLLGTVTAWIIAVRRFKLSLHRVSFFGIFSLLKGGWEVFVSQAGAVVLGNTNIVVLAAVAGPSVVGAYSIAEKIARFGIQLAGPLGIVLFPRVSSLLSCGTKEKAFDFLRKVLFKGGLVFLSVSCAMILLADYGVYLISGSHDSEIVWLVWILSPLPLTVFLDNIFGTQILLNVGHKRLFMLGPIIGGLVAIACQVSLVPMFHATGAACSLLISELSVLAWFTWMTYSKTTFRLFQK